MAFLLAAPLLAGTGIESWDRKHNEINRRRNGAEKARAMAEERLQEAERREMVERELREEAEGRERVERKFREEAERRERVERELREEAEGRERVERKFREEAERREGVERELREEAERRERVERELREEAERRERVERELRELGIESDCVTASEIEQARQDAGFLDGYTHVVVTGNRGSGKSSLINALLGYRPTDSRAAPTGTVETTITRGRFVDKKHIWYDTPGAGTANVTAWQYYYNQKLFAYDLVVISHESTLTEADIRILKVCRLRNQPYVLVRSKSDQHIWNCQNHLDLNAQQAREHYINESRRDGAKKVTIADAEVDLADLLVSDRTVRAIINGEDVSEDPMRAPIDEIKLLQTLDLAFPRT